MAGSLMFTACYFEEDQLFDEDAAQRIDTANKEIQSILVSGSADDAHGWVMQFFVAGVDEARFPGYNLFADFEENGKVTMASDHSYLRNGRAGKYTEHVSFYEMLREKGTVLAFNTWNDVLTVFSDPVDPASAPNRIVDNGEGMHGDHNFLVMSYAADEIILRGERHYAQSRLIPCPKPWQEYLADVKACKEMIASNLIAYHYVVNGADTMYLVDMSKGMPDYRIKPNSNSTKPLSCVFTPDGFRFQDTVRMGQSAFQEFRIAADSTCLESLDSDVRVIAAWDNYLVNRNAPWYCDASLYSEPQKQAVADMDAALKKYNANWSIAAVGLGKGAAAGGVKGIVIKMYTNAAKSKTNTCSFTLPCVPAGFGKVTFSLDEKSAVDRNFQTIAAKSPAFTDAVRAFAATLVGTYQMTPNNYFLPTAVSYAPQGAGTAFKVVAE